MPVLHICNIVMGRNDLRMRDHARLRGLVPSSNDVPSRFEDLWVGFVVPQQPLRETLKKVSAGTPGLGSVADHHATASTRYEKGRLPRPQKVDGA